MLEISKWLVYDEYMANEIIQLTNIIITKQIV